MSPASDKCNHLLSDFGICPPPFKQRDPLRASASGQSVSLMAEPLEVLGIFIDDWYAEGNADGGEGQTPNNPHSGRTPWRSTRRTIRLPIRPIGFSAPDRPHTATRPDR